MKTTVKAVAVLAAFALLVAWTPPGTDTIRSLSDRTGLTSARTAAGSTTASAPADPGDKKLVNLKHVFNFTFEGGDPQAQGTDLDFWTATVPLRDYETGQLVDASGQPLAPGADPVMAERDFVVVGAYDRGAYIFDITDPEAPRVVTLVVCEQPRNDVAVTRVTDTDGTTRWLLAIAKDGGGIPCSLFPPLGQPDGGIGVFDITDPYDWEAMYSFGNTGGAHNFTFHPTEPYGWVSTGDLPGGRNHIPVIDFTDPDRPTLAADVAVEGGPHDVTFSPDGNRAYVASENNYRIYDSTDPAAPTLISRTANPGTYAHGLFATPDGTLMAGNNESLALGGFFAAGTGLCPGEGLTFYDISGEREATPVPVGYYEADVTGRTPDYRACTSHFGNMAPNSQVMTLGWYIAGVRVVDFSDPTQPTEVASAVMPGTEVWSAKTYQGPYVYTGDMGRGFDVYRWTGEGPAPWVGE